VDRGTRCRRTGLARHAPGVRGGLTEQATSHEIHGEEHTVELTSHLFETNDCANAMQSFFSRSGGRGRFYW
jgi:hypothetical protein